jgi:hypothetical protein
MAESVDQFWLCPVCNDAIDAGALRCKSCSAPMQGRRAVEPRVVTVTTSAHPRTSVGASFSITIPLPD